MIYLVRHTATNVAPGVCFGQSDVGLADSYPIELKSVSNKLPLNPVVCFSSPLRRCARLANDLYPGVVQIDPRLMELNFGEWEMRPWNELGQAAVDWGNNFVTTRCPQGESLLDLQRRTLSFLQTLTSYGDKDIVVVTHAGVIRAAMAHHKHLPLARAFGIDVDYGQVIALRKDVA